MTMAAENKSYLGELEVVNIRLVKEPSLMSEDPITSSRDATNLISKFLAEFDREVVCILNLASDGKPISMNVASIGTLSSALVSPKDVLKSSILSNASAFIMFHCHPSGNPKPSRDDAMTTQRLKDAGELLEIKMLDHIIVACGSGRSYSFLESGLLKKKDIVASYNALRVAERER